MVDYDNIYRPARRRFQRDAVHRNYLQREPFMYGSPISDFMPRKRPSVFRERPLQESLVSTLVSRNRPPLPRERPITRSMVAEFLHKKREREKRPEDFLPQNLYGSRGLGLLNRRCTSAVGGQRSSTAAAPRRVSVSAGEYQRSFSMIQALIEEVLPKSSKTVKAGKQQNLAWKHKDSGDQQAPSSPIASPLKNWPVRPASAPFKLSPQNMSPVHLAESLAEKRKHFMRKRPATAPPPRPMFHLPLSRISSSRPAPTLKPQRSSSVHKTSPVSSGASAKNDISSDESRSSARELGSSSSSAASLPVAVTMPTLAKRFASSDEEQQEEINTSVSRSSGGNKIYNNPASRSSHLHKHNTPASSNNNRFSVSGRSEEEMKHYNTPVSKQFTIRSVSSNSSEDCDPSDGTSSSSSSSLTSDENSNRRSSSSSSSSGFEVEIGGGNMRAGSKRSGKKTST